jgi:putative ABC transport system substrate-binding protein
MAFLDGLKNLGWTLGRDFVFEWRQPDSHEPTYERLPRLPGELVGAQMDVIVAWGGPATETARVATKTIPVVFVNVDSPSHSTPAANVTGIFNKASELVGGAPPVASGIGARSLSGGRTSRSRQGRRGGSVRAHARGGSGARPPGPSAERDANLDPAFAVVQGDGAQAMLVRSAAWMIPHRGRIALIAREHGLPLVSDWYYLTQAGGLLSYRWDDNQLLARAAGLVDRIFKGARPADLPVEQPTKFKLALNLKTAKALGMTIPPSLLVRADHVIESRGCAPLTGVRSGQEEIGV